MVGNRIELKHSCTAINKTVILLIVLVVGKQNLDIKNKVPNFSETNYSISVIQGDIILVIEEGKNGMGFIYFTCVRG
jgi:hypothetical protein